MKSKILWEAYKAIMGYKLPYKTFQKIDDEKVLAIVEPHLSDKPEVFIEVVKYYGNFDRKLPRNSTKMGVVKSQCVFCPGHTPHYYKCGDDYIVVCNQCGQKTVPIVFGFIDHYWFKQNEHIRKLYYNNGYLTN